MCNPKLYYISEVLDWQFDPASKEVEKAMYEFELSFCKNRRRYNARRPPKLTLHQFALLRRLHCKDTLMDLFVITTRPLDWTHDMATLNRGFYINQNPVA